MSLNSLLVTLVRHGESQDNQQGIWAGFRDTPLTANGVNQARALGQAFANIPLTAIYSSDLKRAAMTAEAILKANRSIPPPPLVQSKSLREQNFGQAEGQSYASAEWAQGSNRDDARSFRFPDGESLQEVNARIAKAVRQFILPRVEALRKKSPSEAASDVGHICIVAHGIAIAELLRVLMSLHEDSATSPWPDPKTTYKRVRLENTGWSRVELAVPALEQGSGASVAIHDNEISPSKNRTASVSQPAAATSQANQPPGYTDYGEVQADIVEGAAEASRAEEGRDTPANALEATTEARSAVETKPIFVRILCQNQTEHLRGFALQPASNASGSAANHLAGGGGSPNTSTATPAAPNAAGMGLPASATLASIASNATGSTTQSNAILPPPSTPATGGTISNSSASRDTAATPASVRSLSSYDAKMMAKELERAGAPGMLIGSDFGAGSGGSSHAAAPGSSIPSDRQASTTPSSGSMNQGITNRNGYTISPAISASNPSSGTHQASSIGTSSLFGSYPQGSGSNASSATSPNPASFGFSNAPGTSSDVWQAICVRVLPLFNGEPLRTSIEELNETVSMHVRRTLERSPARAVESLSQDLVSLASSGTLTLNSKLQGLDDGRLLVRLVEVWTFFLGQVLPYVEGCFLPFQTDQVLQSFATQGRNASVSVTTALSPSAVAEISMKRIDVRKILLGVFRDQVVLPIYERLFYLFAHIADLDPSFSPIEDSVAGDDGTKQVYLRLLQMTSVLASVLSEDEAQIALDSLLRALRMGSKGVSNGRTHGNSNGLGVRTGSPTQRTNRNGWMAQKARKHGVNSSVDGIGLSAGIEGLPNVAAPAAEALTKLSAGRSFSGRPAALANVSANLKGPYGFEFSEDEYLTSLRSPGGSPAVSTPGQQEPPTPPPKEGVPSTNDVSHDIHGSSSVAATENVSLPETSHLTRRDHALRTASESIAAP